MNHEELTPKDQIIVEIFKSIEKVRQTPEEERQQLWNEFFEKYEHHIPHVIFSDHVSSDVLYKLPDNTLILNDPYWFNNVKYNKYEELNRTEAVELATGQLKDCNSQIEMMEKRKREVNKFLQRHLEENIKLIVKNSKVLPFTERPRSNL